MCTLEWSLTRMGQQVSLHSTQIGKAASTLIATIRPLTRVNTLVLFHIGFECKAFITLTTFIRSLTRVDAHVFFQIAISGIAPFTVAAFMNVLIRVDDLLVHFQSIRSPIASMTISALIGHFNQVFTTVVSDQGVFFCIAFVA